jgi:hypothetical protein
MNFRLWISLLVLTLGGTSARGATLTAGETLRVLFSVDPVDFPCPGTCDTLALFFGASGTSGDSHGPFRMEAELFDGSNPLGSYGLLVCCGIDFKSSTSTFTFLNPPVVDFSTILNGTISGRIDLTVVTGSIFGVDPANFTLFLGHATGGQSVGGNSASLTSSYSTIVTPEPGTLGICLISCVGLLTRLRLGLDRLQVVGRAS